MPEGDALDEMCLLSLPQKVQWKEEEGPLALESINAACGRYGLASSSLPWGPWACLSHLPVDAAPLHFGSHLAGEKKEQTEGNNNSNNNNNINKMYC